TTAGRVIFNSDFPDDFPFQDDIVKKKELATLVDRCARRYSKMELASVLDALKSIGFHYATVAGVTIGLQDVKAPTEKPKIIDEHQPRADKVQQQKRRGSVTEDEEQQEL